MRIRTIRNKLLTVKVFGIPTVEEFETADKQARKFIKIFEGAGLAGNQFEFDYRVIWIKSGDDIVAMIDPIIEQSSGNRFRKEGCFSIPGYFTAVMRPTEIEVSYFRHPSDAERSTAIALDNEAAAVCHELDHLEGILIDTRSTFGQSKLKSCTRKIKGEYIEIELPED